MHEVADRRRGIQRKPELVPRVVEGLFGEAHLLQVADVRITEAIARSGRHVAVPVRGNVLVDAAERQVHALAEVEP